MFNSYTNYDLNKYHQERHWWVENIRKGNGRIYRLFSCQVIRTTFSQFRALRDWGVTNTHIIALGRSLIPSQNIFIKAYQNATNWYLMAAGAERTLQENIGYSGYVVNATVNDSMWNLIKALIEVIKWVTGGLNPPLLRIKYFEQVVYWHYLSMHDFSCHQGIIIYAITMHGNRTQYSRKTTIPRPNGRAMAVFRQYPVRLCFNVLSLWNSTGASSAALSRHLLDYEWLVHSKHRSHVFETRFKLRSRQNGRNFADDILNCVFLN